MKNETLAVVYSCEFCENSENTFFTEHVWATASADYSIKRYTLGKKMQWNSPWKIYSKLILCSGSPFPTFNFSEHFFTKIIRFDWITWSFSQRKVPLNNYNSRIFHCILGNKHQIGKLCGRCHGTFHENFYRFEENIEW